MESMLLKWAFILYLLHFEKKIILVLTLFVFVFFFTV